MLKQISQSFLVVTFSLLLVSCASLRSRNVPEVKVKPPISWVAFNSGQKCSLAIGERAYFQYEFDVPEESIQIWLRAVKPKHYKKDFEDHGFIFAGSESPVYTSGRNNVSQFICVIYRPDRDKYRNEVDRNLKEGLVFRKELRISEISFIIKDLKTGKSRVVSPVPVDITWVCEKDEAADKLEKWSPEPTPVK